MEMYLKGIALFFITRIINGDHWYAASIAPKLKSNPYDEESNYELKAIKNDNDIKNNWQTKIRSETTLTATNESKTPFAFEKLLYASPTNDMESVFLTLPNSDNCNKTDSLEYKNIANISLFKRGIARKHPTTNTRLRPRFLEVFNVVQFEHVVCTSTNGLEGRCLHKYECQSAGGSPMGVCADGYGTCCVIIFSCYGQTSAAVSWLTNPDFPSLSIDRLACVLTLNKTSNDIKQIRLDFVKFELMPPTSGSCDQDQFVVSGQNTNQVVPIICGINTGQHVYIEVEDTVGPIHLTIQTIAAESRLFAIKVTQLLRSDILAAPAGCLQYFNQPHGYIESFNYSNVTHITSVSYPSYLNNLNYAICIKREKSSCSITYTNEDPMQIVNYDTDGLPLIPPRQAGVEIFNCPSDWLLLSAVRLCGERLNDGSVIQDFYLDAPITDISAGPIVVWFRSDEAYVGRGFKVHYQQSSCAMSKK